MVHGQNLNVLDAVIPLYQQTSETLCPLKVSKVLN